MGPRHHEVRRLRALVHDASSRRDEQAFVLEGPRVVAAALDHGAALEAVYLAPGATRAFSALVERVRGAGVRMTELREGVLDRVGSTVTPQPIVAVAPMRTGRVEALAPGGFVLVLAGVQDPGNAGTLIRSALGFGAAGVVFCGNSVDAHNPKVVRSSAGAIFGTSLVEGDDPVNVLETLAATGRRRLGTTATGGAAPDELDLTAPVAFVLGNEAQGLAPDVVDHLDDTVTIPLAGSHVESLNVAMAGTVMCFEAARQRRADGGGG